jgi:DNA repair protein RadC
MDEEQNGDHGGGKLAELGPEGLTEVELLSILVAPGTRGNPAEKIAENILKKYGSIERFGGRPLEELYEIKGRGDTKIIRLAAALEIARRAAYGFLDDGRKKTPQK